MRTPVSPVHQHNPRFLCRLAVSELCAGAPAPSAARSGGFTSSRRSGGRRGWGRSSVPFARPRSLQAGIGPLAALLVSIGIAGCVDSGVARDVTVDELRFPGSASSMSALGRTVLTALTRADRGTLEAFRLTERQHNDVVWPELPASAPDLNFPVDYAWQNIENRNARGLERIIPLYEGRVVSFRRLECRGESEQFTTFEVLTDCWLVFGYGDAGLFEAQIFKDVLARGGGYKIFRYYDDEPRRYRGPGGE
jgi:hypothetical protein